MNKTENMYTKKRIFTKVIAYTNKIKLQWSHPSINITEQKKNINLLYRVQMRKKGGEDKKYK